MTSPTVRIGAVAATAIFLLSLARISAATTDVIFSFEEDEGEYADTDLETDSAGNIYGTTVLGGDFGGGTVFQLRPTPDGWVHTVLYSFTGGADGGEPYKGVTLDREGNLYGTAVTGGSGSCEGGCGVVYKLTNSGGTWTQSVIHAFTGGDDGSGPGARVTVDQSENVYGMTPTGGAYGLGTIYKIHQAGGAWDFSVIHTGGADGGSGSAWTDDSAQRPSLRRGHHRRELWKRSCFRAHAKWSCRMAFQDDLFLPRAARREFSLRRATLRSFRECLWNYVLRRS